MKNPEDDTILFAKMQLSKFEKIDCVNLVYRNFTAVWNSTVRKKYVLRK